MSVSFSIVDFLSLFLRDFFLLGLHAAFDFFDVFRRRQGLGADVAIEQYLADVRVVFDVFAGDGQFGGEVVALDVEVGDFVREVFIPISLESFRLKLMMYSSFPEDRLWESALF